MSTIQNSELFVSAPLVALLEGIFENPLSLQDLSRHGNFGIGTFNELDGEMIYLDGEYFQVRCDGKAYRPERDNTTPFACVTDFQPTSKDELKGTFDWDAFQKAIERSLPSPNMLYAIRIDGIFSEVKVRSVPKQECPRPLVEIAREQPEFTHHNKRGTMVGFYNPQFIVPINAPGLHLHFIDDERTVGGHLLRCSAIDPVIQIQIIPSMKLGLPINYDYLTADLSGDAGKDIHEAESDRGN
ncbi:MAG: acetolactate decarboxylase [Opitutales bacterium]|nr:acetolactate decarboxylase [Opitutales bacterium]MCH8541259.1 acetolactate decarboxylase [Opitutales bacterium]